MVVDLGAHDSVRCPCGRARRAFADVPDAPAGVHRIEIEADVRAHYRLAHTKVDYVLECPAGRRSWMASRWRSVRAVRC